MKAKHLSLALAALAAGGGLWFAWSAWRSDEVAFQKSSIGTKSSIDDKSRSGHKSSIDAKANVGVGSQTPPDSPRPGHSPRAPVPNRRFTDFTPEERVEFARKGHGPGG